MWRQEKGGRKRNREVISEKEVERICSRSAREGVGRKKQESKGEIRFNWNEDVSR